MSRRTLRLLNMKRRTFLATGATSLSAVAGCLGGDGQSEGDPSQITAETDGYPPEDAFDEVPDERDIDTASFGTTEQDGVEVPLVPIDVAHYWYKRREARFADARSEDAYGKSHVFGAVLSQASEQRRSDDDPVVNWPKEDAIVCYCGCPHHLSGIRAAQLMENDYENVYVIEEGFWEWHGREYAMAGDDIERKPENWVIRGEVDAEYAGADAWAHHHPSGQMEATDITDRGTYELHLKFHEVGPDSTIEVDTPAYTVEGKLADLAAGTVYG
jgi:rhodanese-related sulfurtransferase